MTQSDSAPGASPPSHPAYAQLRQVTPVAAVMLENNPGMMTLDGTNTWVLRAPGRDECVVVDPGDHDEEHLHRVAGIGPVALTLVTHRHFDHTGGVEKFAEITGAPVRAVDHRFHRGGGTAFEQGEVIEVAGLVLRILPTPGHTADSVSVVIEPDRSQPGAVLTGDTILGRGTTVLDDSDGDLGDYLTSLRDLIGLGGGRTVLPGHGPDLPDLETVARQYLAHREDRLAQVRSALDTLGADAPVRAVVEQVYSDVDPTLWPVAEKSVNVQLEYLRR
ncbi:MBL fold metallo-hydrolase [Rhodococcus triatomae]|uniref:Glyoxylase, beta-lactamase superfamily II n=1 Tax=Rhodococcus triatomae TaxID=300028 RepID=A0A1G8IHY2_9NOCA|nr:MBL fold metallo-hydrolase [Rhodococcus triatomae]QNG21063.1 MBL fold metallo-hydrolase [Rhodococcus triatomae]QNG23023.1 MBL fold metallo-hydrolase [Rhodococcus triatomae]SDI18546.1 Glyoxylase, beta-lactamase superfamily II [Rhodococcus triatomae]